MGIGKGGAVRKELRTLFSVGAVRELTDGQLLERFATDRGEAAELAFAVLVERHGPMVMRVCRGVLADVHAAQDAFQATFLVLVKRARGLWVRDSIGPWLHQVAYRTATCARATAARRRRLERRAAVSVEESRPDRDFELERLLHEEIDRLPDCFRSPVVLCDLEGRTYEQAARGLGWPIGTVKSRLARGRERLRDRLIRRGVGSDLGPLAVAGAFKVPAIPILPGLLDATTTAAVRFATFGQALPGSAVTLAAGVLRTMTMTQWWKVAVVLIVAGATASGAGWMGAGGGTEAQAPAAKQEKAAPAAPTREVKRGKLTFVRSTRGSVEAARFEDVYCNVQFGSTIVNIVPEGTRVKKGQAIAHLDSSSVTNLIRDQRVAAIQAEADVQNARLTREVAEIALKEYQDGVLPQEKAALDQAIDESRAAIRKIEERLARTREASEQLKTLLDRSGGVKTSADVVAGLDLRDRIDEGELSRVREGRSLAETARRRKLLVDFTAPKTIKELRAEISKAHFAELAKQVTWEREKGKVDALEKQLANCTLAAPIDGIVVYGDPPQGVDRSQWQIEPGVRVRERQVIARVVDTGSPMRINAKVPEGWVNQLSPRMKVRVKVDAFVNVTLDGEITDVAPRPDPPSPTNPGLKLYSAIVQIDRSFDGLRPGMTAETAIMLGEREDAIAVPVGAVVMYDGTGHVALNRPDGRVEWRDVVLGTADDAVVEVKEGLREGDPIILDPAPYLSDEQRARMRVPTRPARKKAAARTKDAGQAEPLR